MCVLSVLFRVFEHRTPVDQPDCIWIVAAIWRIVYYAPVAWIEKAFLKRIHLPFYLNTVYSFVYAFLPFVSFPLEW